jgi:predicted DNA-binding transcriptional regulator AlpA
VPRRHWSPRETTKALEAGKLPDLIGKDAVCALTGWTNALLEVRSRTGEFPKPVEVHPSRAHRWKTEAVAEWLRDHGITQAPRPVSWRGPELYLRRMKALSAAGRARARSARSA